MRILLLISVVAWHVGNFNCATDQLTYTPPNSLEDSIMIFTAKSFKTIAKNKTNNLIYSPLGAWLVLTMTASGSGRRTHLQLRSALALPIDDAKTLNGVQAMIVDFANIKDYELLLGNKIFIDKSVRRNHDFIRFSGGMFGSPPRSVDFNNSDNARKIINEWAAGQTTIKDLVRPGYLDGTTKFLLGSAVHFKGSWARQFATDSTVFMQFYVTPYRINKVPTMRIYDRFVYGELPNAKAAFVKIPYKVKSGAVGLSMFVILPNEMDGLDMLVDNFEQDFTILFDDSRERNVHLHLPKFDIESYNDLKDSLVQMGSYDMFGTSANFKLIDNDNGLMVNKILQKTNFNINETGSDSGSVHEPGPQPPPLAKGRTMSFVVDHPFVCVIATDKKVPIFTAVVNDPIE